MPTLGETIRARRKELGFTQADVSKACGISSPYISEIESDRCNKPGPKSLAKLAAFLEIDLTPVLPPDIVLPPIPVRKEQILDVFKARLTPITPIEERLLMDFLQYIRSKQIT